MRRPLLILLVLALALPAFADRAKARDLVTKANRELGMRNVLKAEKLLREAIREDPDYIKAHSALAGLLYLERKFGAASDEYAAALKLDEVQKQLTEDEIRQTTNQLGVSSALAGNLPKAKQIFEDGIKRDPDYALYRYNLACTYAEMGDLDTAIVHLKEAWDRRKNVAEGERFPDPRQDSSFKKYLNDGRFQDAVRNMVF
jgi:Tfp pilus assembly protein PilF